MSANQSLVKFYERLSTDAELKQQVKAAGNTASVVGIAANLGYEFTEDEFCAFVASQDSDRELAESELEAVAGGMRCEWSAETKQSTSGGTKCCWG